jgi:hypothetical protein
LLAALEQAMVLALVLAKKEHRTAAVKAARVGSYLS